MSRRKYSYAYPMPAIAVDMVVLTIDEGELRVLLIRRGGEPHAGRWAVPGGFVDVGVGYAEGAQGESLDAAAARELEEETGVEVERDGVFLEQLYTFGDPGRDPRGRVVSVAYYALVSPDVAPRVRAGDDAAETRWVALRSAIDRGVGGKKLAFDHTKVLRVARERIEGKIDYDPRLVRALVPDAFTQKELRAVYEIVKDEVYDRSNFAKRFRRMLDDGLCVETHGTGETRGAGRPPKLYRFGRR